MSESPAPAAGACPCDEDEARARTPGRRRSGGGSPRAAGSRFGFESGGVSSPVGTLPSPLAGGGVSSCRQAAAPNAGEPSMTSNRDELGATSSRFDRTSFAHRFSKDAAGSGGWRSACTGSGVSGARIPLATYRLQFNRRFTFRDAHAIVDYLDALGITDCYASSYLKAVPGSPHGYDVADPTRLNPDIGTDEDYWRWIDALRRAAWATCSISVPNHMGIASSANPWWQDVLENGPSSRFARFFDIEWRPVKDELAEQGAHSDPRRSVRSGARAPGAALELSRTARSRSATATTRLPARARYLPGDPAVSTLERADRPGMSSADADELQSIITAAENLPPRTTRDPARSRRGRGKRRSSSAAWRRSPHRARRSRGYRRRDASPAVNGIAGQPRSFDLLDRLLNEQSYRLAHWRVASEEINYRRFFDVNQLAALRMEDPDGLRGGASLRVRADPARRGDRAARRSRRWPVRAGGLPDRLQKRAAGDGGRSRRGSRHDPLPSTSSWKRSSAPASSCPRNGRCTARPATSSPRRSTACSSTGATSAR